MPLKLSNYKLTLQESDIKELIKEQVEQQTGHKVVKVDILINPGYDDRFSSKAASISSVVVEIENTTKATAR